MAVPLFPFLAGVAIALSAAVIAKRRAVDRLSLRRNGPLRLGMPQAAAGRERADQPSADLDIAELLSPAFASRLEAEVRAATRAAVADHRARDLEPSGVAASAPAVALSPDR